MKKSRIASPVPHPESSLRHLPLVDLLVDTETGPLGSTLHGSSRVGISVGMPTLVAGAVDDRDRRLGPRVASGSGVDRLDDDAVSAGHYAEPFSQSPESAWRRRGCMRRILIGFLVATTLLVPACKKKTEGGNVVQLGADDPGLVAAAAEAKRRWPEFVAAFNEHRPGRKCAVKYAAPIKGGGDEQIWIMVTALGSGTISGTLGNAPVEDIGLKLGDAVTIQTGDVKDWLFTDGQSMTGGFSVATLRNAAGKRELFTDGQSMTGGVSISTLKNAAGKRDGK